MLETLRNLVGIQMSFDMAIITAKWIVLWPYLIFSGYIVWRAIKSFLPSK